MKSTIPIIACLLTLCTLAASGRADDDKKAEIALTGFWEGSYSYAGDGTGRPDVAFTAVILQQGKDVTGFIREANTFGLTDDPWLHALLKGTVDPETRKLTFTKTYDGTSGVNHDVEYSVTLPAKADKVDGGTWTIGMFGGTFKLAKDATIKPGKLTGMWQGENIPPEGSEIPTVKVSLVLLHHDKDTILGFAREPRAGVDGTNPWFHAIVKGSYDEKTGEVKLTKSYDGTARASAEEVYGGKLGDKTMSGKRESKGESLGKFSVKREGL